MEPLAGAQESRAEDWYSARLPAAAAAALRRGGGDLAAGAGEEQFVLSGLFWRALLRASVQGGVYLLQSVREGARRGCLREFLNGI